MEDSPQKEGRSRPLLASLRANELECVDEPVVARRSLTSPPPSTLRIEERRDTPCSNISDSTIIDNGPNEDENDDTQYADAVGSASHHAHSIRDVLKGVVSP